jgi:hypothetical protein
MYIDPAAGSMVIQVLIAGVLAATATIKRVRDAIAHFVLRLFRRRKDR